MSALSLMNLGVLIDSNNLFGNGSGTWGASALLRYDFQSGFVGCFSSSSSLILGNGCFGSFDSYLGIKLVSGGNNYFGWDASNILSDHLFALAGQADTPANFDIFAGFNRVINTVCPTRCGSGVDWVLVQLQ